MNAVTRLPALLCLALSSGCVRHTFEPARAANIVAGTDAASANISGIHIVADGDAWSGDPDNLEKLLTPVKVTIENHSGDPLRIRYREFALEGASGLRLRALSPFPATGSTQPASMPIAPGFTYDGFSVAPSFRFYGPAISVWPGEFPSENAAGNEYVYWEQSTSDMIARAIPEGVLSPSGNISGFLYFQKVAKEVKSVDFVARLVQARTGQSLGSARIPFNRKKLPPLIP